MCRNERIEKSIALDCADALQTAGNINMSSILILTFNRIFKLYNTENGMKLKNI